MKTKRKPTPAQLAARERFAEMARSGAFAKGRKRNPADAAPYTVTWKSTASGRMQTSNYRTKAEAVRDAQSLAAEGAKNVEVSKYSPATGAVAVEWRKTNPSIPANIKREAEQYADNKRMWDEYIDPDATTPFDSVSRSERVRLALEVMGYKPPRPVRKTNPARKAAGVRRNPASTAPFKFVCIAPLEYSGSKYGIDERTPVTLKFAKTEPAASTVYACYQLPASVVKNDDFQNFAYHNKVLYMSIAQLRTVLKGYAK